MLLQKLTGLRGGDHSPWRAAQCPAPRTERRTGRLHQPRDAFEQWACASASVVHQLEEQTDAQQHVAATSPSGPLDSVLSHSSTAQLPMPLHGPTTCVRPACYRPTTTALVTPSKLAALSAALRMPVKQLQQLLVESPHLLTVPPEHLTLLQQAIQEELGMSAHAARQLITRQSEVVLTTPLPDLRARAEELAALLSVAPREVVRAAGRTPSMLARKPTVVAGQLQRMAEALGGQPMVSMLRMASAAPQFLTESPGSVSSRLSSFSAVLHKPPRLVVRALAGQPDMLFMSPRVMRNKLGVLQAILDRQARLVVPIVLACPGLLRCDMDAVRAAYAVLRPISSRDANFTFGMVCHAPHLLLEHPQELAGQARHVHHLAKQVPSWQAQLSKFNPAQAADCLGQSAPTYARLNYLAATQQAESITLHAALTMPRSTFLARFPGAAGIKEAVKQPMQLAPVPRWQGSMAQLQSQEARAASHMAAAGHTQATTQSAYAQPAAIMQARLRAREEASERREEQGHGEMHDQAAWQDQGEAMQHGHAAHATGHISEPAGVPGQSARRRRRPHFSDEDFLRWQPQEQHPQEQQLHTGSFVHSVSPAVGTVCHGHAQDLDSVVHPVTAPQQPVNAPITLQPWYSMSGQGVTNQGMGEPLAHQHLDEAGSGDWPQDTLQGEGHSAGHNDSSGNGRGTEAQGWTDAASALQQHWQAHSDQQHGQDQQHEWWAQQGEHQQQTLEPHTPGRPCTRRLASHVVTVPQQQQQQQQQLEATAAPALAGLAQPLLHVHQPHMLGFLPSGLNGMAAAGAGTNGHNGHASNQALLSPPLHRDIDAQSPSFAHTAQEDLGVQLVQGEIDVCLQDHEGAAHGDMDIRGGRQRRARHRPVVSQLDAGSCREVNGHQEASIEQEDAELQVMRLGSSRVLSRRGALATRV